MRTTTRLGKKLALTQGSGGWDEKNLAAPSRQASYQQTRADSASRVSRRGANQLCPRGRRCVAKMMSTHRIAGRLLTPSAHRACVLQTFPEVCEHTQIATRHNTKICVAQTGAAFNAFRPQGQTTRRVTKPKDASHKRRRLLMPSAHRVNYVNTATRHNIGPASYNRRWLSACLFKQT